MFFSIFPNLLDNKDQICRRPSENNIHKLIHPHILIYLVDKLFFPLGTSLKIIFDSFEVLFLHFASLSVPLEQATQFFLIEELLY